jgi:hypothetical protein
MKIYKCKICKRNTICYQTVYYGFGLCNTCSKKGKNNWRYNPERHKKYYCKCGNKICYNTWKKGLKMCGICCKIGKHHTQTTREKIKRGNLGKKLSIATRKKLSKAKTIHGLSHLPYSKEFTQSLKNEIRQRDNYICQCCSMSQEEHMNKYSSSLEVHHIDHCTDNCDKSNLITLCKKCNNQANQDRDYWYAYFTYKINGKLSYEKE